MAADVTSTDVVELLRLLKQHSEEGMIKVQQLSHVLRKFDDSGYWTDERLQALFAAFCPNGECAINCAEFAQDLFGAPAGEEGTAPKEVAAEPVPSIRIAGYDYDLLVIGAGPVGISAATLAANRGKHVGVVEPQKVVTGAPTGAHSKCLREAAENGATTWEEVQGFITRSLQRVATHTAGRLERSGAELLAGNGKILNQNTVRFTPADGSPVKDITCGVIVLATGSQSNRFPPVNFDLPGVYDSDTVSQLTYLPETLVVQGAGIIGLEYALIFAKLGSKVTVVETFDALVPMLDIVLQENLRKTMKENGVELMMKTPVKATSSAPSSTPEKPKVLVDIGEGRILECDCLVSACGRHGVTEGLGLEAIEGLKIGRGKCVEVDDYGWTGVGNVYACGDVAGGGLATIGEATAIRAIRKCFGSGKVTDSRRKEVKPFGIWTLPEIAWAGMNEQEAVKGNINFGATTVDYRETIRGCVSDSAGFMKLIFDRDTGRVLGVHIFGESACDIVNYGAELVNDRGTIFDMLKFVFPAVTYHQLYHVAALSAKKKFQEDAHAFDFLVLGAGPVGMKAATEAASRGCRVGIIEPKATITGGPTGTHSKCLREAALAGATTWEQCKKVLERSTDLTQTLAKTQLSSNKVEVLKGAGTIIAVDKVKFWPVSGSEPRTLSCNVMLIATGSKSNRFPPADFGLDGVFDSDTIGGIKYLPKHMVVQGAGIIGLEYAMIFAKLGAKVTIVETFDKVVPFLDEDLQKACLKILGETGIEIRLKTPIKSTAQAPMSQPDRPSVLVQLEDSVLSCDALLSACGRHGCSTGLGLEVLEAEGLKINRGKFIEVDDYGWTGVGNVYAAGDVAGANLATIGTSQAVRMVRKAFGSGHVVGSKLNGFNPFGIWTVPEIAWAGITEEKAKADGLSYGVSTVRYNQTIRGCISAEIGFLKLIFDNSNGCVLGVHIFGENACDLINYGAEVVISSDTVYDILRMVFPAVTFHMLYHHAAQSAKLQMTLSPALTPRGRLSGLLETNRLEGKDKHIGGEGVRTHEV